MTFIWPAMLIALIIVPVLVLVYVRLQQRRRRLVASYGSMGLFAGAARRPIGVRRHVPPLIFLAAIVLLALALARPQAIVSLPRMEGTVVLAFDVSGSMAADDLKPTRMEAAKTAAEDFLNQQPATIPIGVVAFSDNGLTVQAPTLDREKILATIKRLSPQRGTSLASGMLAAINVLQGSEKTRYYTNLTPTPTPSPTPVPAGVYMPGVIVLLTDGENNQQPDPMTVAKLAADRGIRIYTVGIGSPAGANLSVEGFTIHTQLDEPTLQALAAATGGTYFNAQSTDELRTIYGSISPQLVTKSEKQEITYLLAGISIVLLLIGSAFSLLWFGRVP
jgi:Ca-activated chloride channel family protein